MTLIKAVFIVLGTLIVAGLAVVYSGAINLAADTAHWALTQRVIEIARERSIAVRADDTPAVALDDPALLALGAEHYREMCTGCHLAPGMEESEIRPGLNPKPPNLSLEGADRLPAETFWIIKHGLKMTGMPAWGLTHDDRVIWAMTAFVQRLPSLTPAQYAAFFANDGAEHDDAMSAHEDTHP